MKQSPTSPNPDTSLWMWTGDYALMGETSANILYGCLPWSVINWQ